MSEKSADYSAIDMFLFPRSCDNCDGCLSRVGWIGLALSIFIAGFTISIGLITNSKALMATSLCAGIDAVTALIIILGLKLSSKSIDLNHPYGHGKVEYIVVGLVSLMLIMSAILLLVISINSIYAHHKGPDQWITLAAALVAGCISEIKHRYARCVGTKFKSPAVLTHAEHARIDAISSAAVATGVISARAGLHFVDPLIAILEVGHILKASYKMLMRSVNNLMDASVPKDVVHHIQDILIDVDGIKEINYLNARQTGQEYWIELSIYIDPEMTIYEGNTIASNTRQAIINNLDSVGNVQVQFISATT